MKTLEISNATSPLATYTRRARKEPVILMRRGKPVAALVSIANADMETVSLSNNPEFLALIERSRLRQQSEGGISSSEMRKRLKLQRRKSGSKKRSLR